MSPRDLDLSKIWLFSTSSAKDLRTIRRALEEVTVPPGRVLCEQGTIGREFFLIVSGQAAVRRNNRKVATLGPGQYFGEMALLTNNRRNATIRAASKVRVAALGKKNFMTLLSVLPGTKEDILKTVQARAMAQVGGRR